MINDDELLDLRKSLSQSITPNLKPSVNQEEKVAGSSGAEPALPCEKCHGKKYIYEGRPYFLRALLDYKCDDVDRLIKVPIVPAEDTPRVSVSKHAYSVLDPQHRASFKHELAAGTRLNEYWAMSKPDWLPSGLKGPALGSGPEGADLAKEKEEEEEDEFANFDSLGLEPMDTDSIHTKGFGVKDSGSRDGGHVDDDGFVMVPLKDLLFFGDPLSTEYTYDSDSQLNRNPWDVVRRLHNSMRITSIRSPPILEEMLRKKLELDVSCRQKGQAMGPDFKLSKICPYFKKPDGCVPYARQEDALRRTKRYSSVGVRYSGNGDMIEGYNESLLHARNGKIYVEDDSILDEVQSFIRANIPGNDKNGPYAEIEVVEIYYNETKREKPVYYYVYTFFPV